MRVLLIESDDAVAHGVKVAFEAIGAIVEKTDDGDDGVSMARAYEFDAIVLDSHPKSEDGVAVIRRLRPQVRTPIILLSRELSREKMVQALDLGADDFLQKPFAIDELLARTAAVVRRQYGQVDSKLRFGPIEMDTITGAIDLDGKRIRLTRKESSVLELLLMRRNSVVTKTMILDHLYNQRDEPEIKIVDVFVCKIRRKLEEASGGQNFIETVWGRGYMIKNGDAKMQKRLVDLPNPLSAAI